jgi:serpin B
VLIALAVSACGAEGGSDEPVVLAASDDVERAGPSSSAPVQDLAAGFNDAGFALLREQPLEDNLVFSPTSVGHALLMARAAADDATGEAIDTAFALPEGLSAHEAWNSADQAIIADADRQEELIVTIADRIWPKIGLTPDQGWIDLLASHHGADTEALDYDSDPDGSRDVINGWVSDQTEDLIPELLPEGFVKPGRTVLVLTDAMYFEAPWLTPFGKYPNVEDVFTRLDGSTVDTEYMTELELGDRRGVGDGFVGAEIPYEGGDFSMLVIVPDEGRFEDVRQRLGQDLLDEIDASFTTGPYELIIPKWETTTQLDLVEWLRDMGASPGKYPSISATAALEEAVHGADIAVDEWGTVAAAATALGFEESGPPEPELTVRADRPFIYLIRHRPSGLVLFAGQVMDPTS